MDHNNILFFFKKIGQGGHAYLKEGLWWAGLLSSKYLEKTMLIDWKHNHLFIHCTKSGVVAQKPED